MRQTSRLLLWLAAAAIALTSMIVLVGPVQAGSATSGAAGIERSGGVADAEVALASRPAVTKAVADPASPRLVPVLLLGVLAAFAGLLVRLRVAGPSSLPTWSRHDHRERAGRFGRGPPPTLICA